MSIASPAPGRERPATGDRVRSDPSAPGRPSPRAGAATIGHGRRLLAAFAALEDFPVLLETRERLLRALRSERPARGEIVALVESDAALLVTVLRAANRGGSTAAGVPAAIDALTPAGLEAVVGQTSAFDFFERTAVWDVVPEHFRLHAVATQRLADRLGRLVCWRARDELRAAALLHDLGKLVLRHAYAEYAEAVPGAARAPAERLHDERRQLGIDHAVVGGVLLRRWGLPAGLATVVERHHADDPEGAAAIVRLADMLAHYAAGDAVDRSALLPAARAAGVGAETLRSLLYELPSAGEGGRRGEEPSPLSVRESHALRGLAEGKVYKEIAADLGVSTSTVRTHLHNVYAKLGVGDRAQAVLVATERGWL